MQQFFVLLLVIVLVVIVAYAVFQHKPSGLAFKNFLAIFKRPTSTPFSGSSWINQPKLSAPSAPTQTTSGTYSAPPRQLQINPSEIPPGFTLQNLSPYFKKISISASPGSLTSYSRITLYGYFDAGQRVDITGWELRGNRGGLYIPNAVDVYEPSGLAGASDINLKNGDVLYIYSTASPIGVNLHLNKCIGYLANSNVFNPPFSLNCPYINRSDISGFTGQCQNYVLSLGSCKLPDTNLPFLKNDSNCQTFLNTINYGGCFTSHRSDSDFLSNQWIVWSGSKFLDFSHDHLLLFDKQGLLVNIYDY